MVVGKRPAIAYPASEATVPINVRAAALVGLVLGIVAHGPALAGPPYVTDDPKTLPRQAWEIIVPYVLLQSTDPRTALTPLFDINYGLTDAVQFSLQVPIVDVGTDGGPDSVGLGDTQVGVKWRFLDEDGRRPQLAFNPQIGFPTGSERQGLGAGSLYYVLPVMAEKSWGPWAAFTNVGWVVQTASATKDFAYYGAVLTRAAGETLRLGAELHGNGATAPGASSDLGWNAGVEWQMAERCALHASGGHSLHGGRGTKLYLGIQILLGKWPAE